MTYPEILVLRHGQTEWNKARRHQGQLDSPLTALGLAQAADQGRILARLDVGGFAAYASPQLRAARTADIALSAIGMSACLDPRLKEVAFGAWEGRTAEEIAADRPGHLDEVAADTFGIHFRAPGGETLPQMESRCAAFLDDLTGPSIIVCHGITSRVLRGLWLGLDEPGMAALPGGQGCVYHLKDGTHTRHDP